MKCSIFPIVAFSKVMIPLALLSLATMDALAQSTFCIDTNTPKWIQPPQTQQGLDVKDSRGVALADDFPCVSKGPITDIHIWGSWLNEQPGTITNFWIGIYDDVPAVPGPVVIPSHPGTNLLWSQDFPIGTFAQSIYTNGNEYFFDPKVTNIIGGDQTVWYYCFYPANPFVQQGSANNPTNYWLAVVAQVADPNTNIIYGWKTTYQHSHDAAVWIPAANGKPLPTGVWNPMFDLINQTQVDLAFKLTTTNTPSVPCVDTGGNKYDQEPNLDLGFDVWNSSPIPPQITDGPWVLADDFVCNQSGQITDLHLWGSWLNNQSLTNSITFTLGIYDDVGVSATNSYSHPGNLLWSQTFVPGQYAETMYGTGTESFLDPGPPVSLGPENQVWYYCFNPTNLFQQKGHTYWLAAFAQLPPVATTAFGWKSTRQFSNDISVHAPWPGTLPSSGGGWIPTLQSPAGGPLDLAFKITTALPQPVVCVESDFDKYVQSPNIFGGFDVLNNPYVLADDFVCTNTGPLSDIHLWGSWLNDLAQTNSITFWLGIYDDVPVGTGNTFSHPGTNLLWQQWFNPGEYAESIWTNNAQELFLDPGPSNALSSDSVVWYYCFYPTNAFQQTGTTNNAKTYWLSAYAQFPVGASKYGWKTTTTVLKDTSVHAIWPGSPPIANPGWTPTGYQPPAGGPPVPLDLAFKLTMCGPLIIHWLPPTNVVVIWPGLGHLQSATNVSGPYVDIPGSPISPFIDYSVNPTNKFYRLRCY